MLIQANSNIHPAQYGMLCLQPSNPQLTLRTAVPFMYIAFILQTRRRSDYANTLAIPHFQHNYIRQKLSKIRRCIQLRNDKRREIQVEMPEALNRCFDGFPTMLKINRERVTFLVTEAARYTHNGGRRRSSLLRRSEKSLTQ